MVTFDWDSIWVEYENWQKINLHADDTAKRRQLEKIVATHITGTDAW